MPSPRGSRTRGGPLTFDQARQTFNLPDHMAASIESRLGAPAHSLVLVDVEMTTHDRTLMFWVTEGRHRNTFVRVETWDRIFHVRSTCQFAMLYFSRCGDEFTDEEPWPDWTATDLSSGVGAVVGA